MTEQQWARTNKSRMKATNDHDSRAAATTGSEDSHGKSSNIFTFPSHRQFSATERCPLHEELGQPLVTTQDSVGT